MSKSETTTTTKTYNCSQARIIAKNGETFKADIMEVGESYTNRLYELRDNVRADYWQLHSSIASESFDYKEKQTSALVKLAQLALAVDAIEKAYSAANTIRCF